MPRTIKARDSYPGISVLVGDANGPLDLTAALGAIKVFIQPPGGGSLITLTGTKRANQTGVGKGWVDAPLTTTTLTSATVGGSFPADCETEVQVAWDVGATQITTFPQSGYDILTVEADLGQ